MSQPATRAYTFGPQRPTLWASSIRTSLAGFARLETVQVVCIIALGLLGFAALGVCGGEAQHRRAMRIWKLMIALSIVIVVGLVAWRFPYELLAPSGF